MEGLLRIIEVVFSYTEKVYCGDETEPAESTVKVDTIKIAVSSNEGYKNILEMAEEKLLKGLPTKDEIEDPNGGGAYQIDLCYDDIQLLSYKILAEEN